MDPSRVIAIAVPGKEPQPCEREQPGQHVELEHRGEKTNHRLKKPVKGRLEKQHERY